MSNAHEWWMETSSILRSTTNILVLRIFPFFLTDMLTLAHWKTECLKSRKKKNHNGNQRFFFLLSFVFRLCLLFFVLQFSANLYTVRLKIFSCSCHVTFIFNFLLLLNVCSSEKEWTAFASSLQSIGQRFFFLNIFFSFTKSDHHITKHNVCYEYITFSFRLQNDISRSFK